MVAEGAAQGQLAVHAVHHHRVTCCLNAFGFLEVVGFVVEAEWEGIVAALADDGATVTSIRAVNMRLVYKDYAGRAASVLRFFTIFYLIVQLHECLLECVFIVALLKFLIIDELLLEVLFCIISRFLSPVPIKDTEEHAIAALDRHLLANVGILHARAPALHTAGAPAKVVVFAGLRIFIFDWCVQKTSHCCFCL